MKRFIFFLVTFSNAVIFADLPLFWWQPSDGSLNFGDELSRVVVEKLIHREVFESSDNEKRLLAVGSIIHFARDGDVVWGSGINGKHPNKEDYSFRHLDIRCVRGPLTRKFLKGLGINVPRIYGDPAMLLPLLFPEFHPEPLVDYIVIPHISEMELFHEDDRVVMPTEPWDEIVRKILKSKFVISSSLHGIIVSEAFGIPARLLKVTNNEPLFKYADYYAGTGRKQFEYATSIDEALLMGGEPLPHCNHRSLLKSFPWNYFPK